MKKLLLPIITLALAVSCQEAELTPGINMEDDCLYGTMESMDATKTSMDENNNVLWSEGDQLVAFMKTTLGRKYQIKEEYVGSTTGGFSRVTEESSGADLESGNELNHNVVLYPYASTSCMKNDNNETANSYKVNLNLPETQTYAVGSFGKGSFPMIAVSSSNELLFKNICGGIKLQFKGIDKIKSLKLESIGGEKISGKATVIGSVDGTAPVITMTDNDKSYTHVTLDCGEGVQLSETTPTAFIIALPPIEFASGMKITVTDTDGLSRTLTNSSSNTIKRSSLLTFPVITYLQEGVFEIPEGTLTSYEILAEGGIIEIPLTTNQDYQIVIPEEAQDWISIAETKVLRNETLTLVIAENTIPEARSTEVIISAADGTTLQSIIISQEAGVIIPTPIDYIDEYGINHGKGVLIDGVIWAPVNCGYHANGFKYGKLYQWGRKYGQGYNGDFYDGDYDQKYLDAIVPKTVSRSASLSEGQDKSNKNIYYAPSGSDWLGSSSYDDLWNIGNSSEAVKSEYDPCPAGWRVPTYDEFYSLKRNKSSWTTDDYGRAGVWFTGSNEYSDNSNRIFLPAGGRFTYYGYATDRGYVGYYWTSEAASDNKAYYLLVYSSYTSLSSNGRIYGCSVRCIQDFSYESTPEVPEIELEPEPGPSCIVNENDYLDEYNINHGPGIKIGKTIWAPVNCGYHTTDFKYGKLYQWGRKYGQGYSGAYWDGEDWDQTFSDASVPKLLTGTVDITIGQAESCANNFYYNSDSPFDWLNSSNDLLWNRQTDEVPIKTNYDPCPEGWRVPTYLEFEELSQNKSEEVIIDGQAGYWFSGATPYAEDVPRIFFSAAGKRGTSGTASLRGSSGYYWSSKPIKTTYQLAAYAFCLDYMTTSYRANGHSVRCVKE